MKKRRQLTQIGCRLQSRTFDLTLIFPASDGTYIPAQNGESVS
ncbi:hypothetical protein [Paenibacillus sp. FSL K6-2859]